MSPTRPRRSRRTLQWPVVIWLTIVWLMLWGSISPLMIVGGVLASTAILLAFPLPPIQFDGRVHPFKLVSLIAHFAKDLTLASFQVAWLAIRPGAPPLNAVIEVDLMSDSELYLTITAELVSLVPGSLLIEVSRTQGRLYLHILGAKDLAGAEKARAAARTQERRVVEALASGEELAGYRANISRDKEES